MNAAFIFLSGFFAGVGTLLLASYLINRRLINKYDEEEEEEQK